MKIRTVYEISCCSGGRFPWFVNSLLSPRKRKGEMSLLPNCKRMNVFYRNLQFISCRQSFCYDDDDLFFSLQRPPLVFASTDKANVLLEWSCVFSGIAILVQGWFKRSFLERPSGVFIKRLKKTHFSQKVWRSLTSEQVVANFLYCFLIDIPCHAQ